MKIGNYFFLFIFLLIALRTNAQFDLSITIPTPKEKGEVLLGIFNGPKLYLEESGMFRHCRQKIDGEKVVCRWEDLPAGNYSAAVLVDLNSNKKMDFTWFGWPKESYGFYPDPGFLMRKPRWKECNFELKEDLDVVIRMR